MMRCRRRGWKKLLGLAVILSGLSACTTSTVVVDNYCQLYRPVSWADGDTPGTIGQIDINNGIYECKCNSDCPKVEK